MSIKKLEFLHKYGSDKQKISISGKIDDAVNKLSASSDSSGASSSLVNGEHLDKMVHHKDENFRSNSAQNPNLKPDHIEHIINRGTSFVKFRLSHNMHVNLSDEHIHKLIDHRGGDIHPAMFIGVHRKLNDEHWEKIAKHSLPVVARGGVASGNMPMKYLQIAANHKDSDVRHAANEAIAKVGAGDKPQN